MCELFTVMGTAITVKDVLALAGTAMSVMGSMQQSQAQQGQAEYQAAVARNQALAAQYAADDAIKRGELAADQSRLKTAQLAGRQESLLAASGVQLDSGSPLDVLGDTAAAGAYDALIIKSNAEREAWALKNQAAGYESDATMFKTSAANTASQRPLTVGASLLTGLSSLGGRSGRKIPVASDSMLA